MPLINCQVSLTWTWSEKCVEYITKEAANPKADPVIPAINAPTSVTFQITDTKFYAPVVTLSAEDNNKLLEQLKSGSKRTIKRNEWRSEMANHTKTNNLNYLIHPRFNKVNR